MTIRKGDTIRLIAGKDRGKQGVVEKVIPTRNRIVVTGLNLRKRHFKPSQSRPRGGIVEVPGSLDASNAMIVCGKCNKPTRVKVEVITEKDGSTNRFRVCTHCKARLDS